MKNIKCIITVVLFSVFLFLFSAMCCFSSDSKYSDSERRELAQLPTLNFQTISSGEFMNKFENYTADQFPFRDKFRSAKALFSSFVLNKSENNGIILAGGHISKIDKEENEYMMDYAAEIFRDVYDKNIKGKNANVYFSVVPDKNYYLAEKYLYPSLNYKKFIDKMKSKTDYMNYIDITKHLSDKNYYRTDTHWKQETISDVAQVLAQAMGADVGAEYTVKTLDNPFKGVYYGQGALPVKPDTIKYLTNETLENSTVTYYDTGKPEKRDMYNMKKAFGKDPYEMFLSGVAPLVVIDNPNAKSDKELVIFRDSFGSSLAPLMVEGYSKVTVVDLRYMSSSFVGNFVKFDNADVLFIYSSTILNDSLALKK